MATCLGDTYVELIERTECIGNSLAKINNNFAALDAVVCSTEGTSEAVKAVSGIIKGDGNGNFISADPDYDYYVPGHTMYANFNLTGAINCAGNITIGDIGANLIVTRGNVGCINVNATGTGNFSGDISTSASLTVGRNLTVSQGNVLGKTITINEGGTISGTLNANTINLTTINGIGTTQAPGSINTTTLNANGASSNGSINTITVNATTINANGNGSNGNINAVTGNITTINATTINANGNGIDGNINTKTATTTTLNATTINTATLAATGTIVSNSIVTSNITATSNNGTISAKTITADIINTSTLGVPTLTLNGASETLKLTSNTAEIIVNGTYSTLRMQGTDSQILIQGVRGKVEAKYLYGEIMRCSGDITAFWSSDERLKKDITLISNPLEKVSSLRGVEYQWDTELQDVHEGKDIGVIAQDVEAVFPEIVTTRTNGYKAVKYERLIPLLIEAVKELKDQNISLREEVEALKLNKCCK